MFLGIKGLEEPSTYQAILEEGEAIGEVREARRVVLRLGARTLGTPDAASIAAIEAIDKVEALPALIDHVMTATSWQDLLSNAER